MTGPDRRNRHHLRLLPADFPTGPPADTVNRPSPQTLAARIVSAAQTWAAEVLSSPLTLDPDSPEGRARLALLDAVHDLEYHDARPVIDVPLPLEFGTDEPGTP